MPKRNPIDQALFSYDEPPFWQIDLHKLYRTLGTVAVIGMLGLGAFLILGPHWTFPAHLLSFGTPGSAPGMLDHPNYIGLDGQGNIYIADWSDGRINVFDPGGKFLRLINLGAHTNILGMAVTPDGTVYLSYDGKIHRLDSNGNATTLAYADAKGDLIADISGIAVGADGTVAAADNLGDILRFGADGSAKPLLPRAFDLPSFSSRNELEPNGAPILSYDVRANSADTNISMAVDSSGNIYALGWDSGHVLKTDAEGNSLSNFGAWSAFPGGWQRGHFDFPDALVTDSYGRIYVADSSGVQVFTPDEKYLLSIPVTYGVDAMTIDPENNLYVVSYPAQVVKLAALNP